MKRTKSMIYQETTEARELFLFATNNARLYKMQIHPAIDSLHKKYVKGTYNEDKAVDLFYCITTSASDMYLADFGYKFNVQERFTAAVMVRDYFTDEIKGVN